MERAPSQLVGAQQAARLSWLCAAGRGWRRPGSPGQPLRISLGVWLFAHHGKAWCPLAMARRMVTQVPLCRRPDGCDGDDLPKGTSEDALQRAWTAVYWGQDLCKAGGVLDCVYQALGIPSRSWSGLKHLPEVGSGSPGRRCSQKCACIGAHLDAYRAVQAARAGVRTAHLASCRWSIPSVQYWAACRRADPP